MTLDVPSQHLVTAACMARKKTWAVLRQGQSRVPLLGTDIVDHRTIAAVETRVRQHPHAVSGRGAGRLVSLWERVDSLERPSGTQVAPNKLICP